MKLKIWLPVALLLVVGSGSLWYFVVRDTKPIDSTTSDAKPSELSSTNTKVQQKKTPHYESNTPAADSVLASAPTNVVIDFNFDLADGSTIDITMGGKSYASGETVIDSNKLALRRTIDPAAPNGTYVVDYNACWPDGSCHDGKFGFTIDSAVKVSYIDMTGKSDIEIRMSQLKFQPVDVRVSKGTTITWVNDDSVIHYVNTDSHPAHTHVSDLNSKALANGESYQFAFNNPGAYPYHCSAHAANMIGNIVVE